jgi:hypothetical protein
MSGQNYFALTCPCPDRVALKGGQGGVKKKKLPCPVTVSDLNEIVLFFFVLILFTFCLVSLNKIYILCHIDSIFEK